MSTYKLTYFNIRGKAEVIRFLFALADVKYEDIRVERKNWTIEKQKIKPMFGQLPLLSIDGQVFCQAYSISKHLAQKFGYDGKTDLDRLRADMIVHCIEDMARPMGKAIIEEDPVTKVSLTRTFVTEQLPVFSQDLENILKQNNGGDGFFVGDSLTWADLYFYHYVTTYIPHVGVDLTKFYKNHPKQLALLDRVPQIPRLADYLAQRPPSKF